MEFRLIHPGRLRAEWGCVKQALAAVKAKNAVDWIDEDVYHAIKSGASALHFAEEDGEFLGLMVSSLNASEFRGEPELHVWIAYSVADDILGAGIDFLRAMAVSAGAKRITFDSPRLGWSKRYTLLTATYGIEL